MDSRTKLGILAFAVGAWSLMSACIDQTADRKLDSTNRKLDYIIEDIKSQKKSQNKITRYQEVLDSTIIDSFINKEINFLKKEKDRLQESLDFNRNYFGEETKKMLKQFEKIYRDQGFSEKKVKSYLNKLKYQLIEGNREHETIDRYFEVFEKDNPKYVKLVEKLIPAAQKKIEDFRNEFNKNPEKYRVEYRHILGKKTSELNKARKKPLRTTSAQKGKIKTHTRRV